MGYLTLGLLWCIIIAQGSQSHSLAVGVNLGTMVTMVTIVTLVTMVTLVILNRAC